MQNLPGSVGEASMDDTTWRIEIVEGSMRQFWKQKASQ